jgi:hypothetical protein
MAILPSPRPSPRSPYIPPTRRAPSLRRQQRKPLKPAHRTTDEFFTPADAVRLLAETPFERQRPLNELKVAEQLHYLVTGHLRPCTTITLACVNGRRYLVNGQHTLTALSRWRGAGYWLSVEVYTVRSEEQVAELYKTFDRQRIRTLPDLYRADARYDTYGLARKELVKLGAAVPVVARGFRTDVFASQGYWYALLKDFHVRDALIGSWAPAMREVQAALGGARNPVRNHLLRASVLSVMLVTYRHGAAAAGTFWPQVAADSGLVSGTPTHTLSRWLWEHTARQHNPADAQRYVASAWNAHVGQRPLKQLRLERQADQPILLAGTPHDGRAHYGYLGKDGQVWQEPRAVEG